MRVALCAISNHTAGFTRPEWIAHRDVAPIEPVGTTRRSATPARAAWQPSGGSRRGGAG